MDDIKRQDRRLFVRELARPWRVLLTFLILIPSVGSGTAIGFLFGLLVLLGSAGTAWLASTHNRWLSPRMQSLWAGCEDRLARFEEVLGKMRKEQIADLREMPQTIREVHRSLYCALRRADMIAHEVQQSERDLYAHPPPVKPNSADAQSQELYRLADKNIAEYRSQFAGVMSGVQRTEAQSAVFMTTLDTLRMKMIGYRLVGRSPELQSHDFLQALAEARTQLQAIDTALEELDLGHYPQSIAVVPPPIPEEAIRRIEQGR